MHLTLLKKYAETGDIWSFVFKTDKPVTWVAGQSLRIEIPGPYGALERRFTIASPPHSGVIMVTTRKSDSDFKQALFALHPGEGIRAHGLEGTFTWRENNIAPIFIAAGVGITPFYAMLMERTHRQLPLAATLIYGGSNGQLAFRPIFDSLQNSHAGFSVHYITDERITAAHITHLAPDIIHRDVYISGPSTMVDDLSAELLAYGVAENAMIRDWFTGQLSRDG